MTPAIAVTNATSTRLNAFMFSLAMSVVRFVLHQPGPRPRDPSAAYRPIREITSGSHALLMIGRRKRNRAASGRQRQRFPAARQTNGDTKFARSTSACVTPSLSLTCGRRAPSPDRTDAQEPGQAFTKRPELVFLPFRRARSGQSR